MEIIKHPINNIFVVYLGTKKEVQEISLCRKEKDKNGNTYYLDLLTDTTYPTSSNNENEIIGLKEFTLLGILKNTNYRNKIIENKYLTNNDLLEIYDKLNEDSIYQEFNVDYDEPPFIQSYFYDTNEIVWENQEEVISQIIISLKTSKKIIIISGESGIGKSTLKDKICAFEDTNDNITDIEGWFVDYNEMLKNATTNLHVQNRINITINCIKQNKDEPMNLYIDDVDFSNTYFIKSIVEVTQKNNIPLILISSTKLDKSKFDDKIFKIIEIKELQDETKKEIFNNKLIETDSFYLPLDIPTDDLINILLECDKGNFMNQTNYTKNPKLGITIIENALYIAAAHSKESIEIDDFIDAFNQDNINMSQANKKTAIESLERLKTKTKKISIFKKETIPNQRKKQFRIFSQK